MSIRVAINYCAPLAALLATLACAVGCGTLSNVTGRERAGLSAVKAREPRLYGGVRNDLEWLNAGNAELSDVSSDDALLVAFYAADIPSSFVADTVTIPLVLWQQGGQETDVEGH